MHVNVKLIALQSILGAVIHKGAMRRQHIGAEKQSKQTNLSTSQTKYLVGKYS